MKEKGFIRSKTLLSGFAGLGLSLTSVLTLILNHQDEITAALQTYVPAPWNQFAIPVMSLVMLFVHARLGKGILEGRNEAAKSGTIVKGIFRKR